MHQVSQCNASDAKFVTLCKWHHLNLPTLIFWSFLKKGIQSFEDQDLCFSWSERALARLRYRLHIYMLCLFSSSSYLYKKISIIHIHICIFHHHHKVYWWCCDTVVAKLQVFIFFLKNQKCVIPETKRAIRDPLVAKRLSHQRLLFSLLFLDAIS